jgi:hypothetical protein
MADVAKIFRINYKSDFILTLTSDAGWMTPFCIKFWTGAPSQAYYVSWNGETYNHCSFAPSEPTKLLVQFDDHHLPIGNLKFQVAYHFTVADFPNDTEDEVINPANITTEIDGETYQVMLDFTGETAPEIQFALPAYANEAQRIDNEQQRIAAETQRIANEETRIQHEESRIAAEQTRQQNEQQRINQEQARVNEYASLKADAVAATGAANDAAALANQKAQLAADKAALAQAAADLANAKAQLAADKAALAASAAQLANDKAALAQQKAEYAQTQGGYAKDQGDYAKDKGDICSADHLVAVADHGIAVDDHTQAGNDHTRAESDHGIAVDDHTKAGNDHTRAESDHGIAADDHTQAGTDHQTAAADHQTATADHTQAGNDHTRAESDHTRAESDHAAVEVYVDSLGAFDISAYHATGGVLAKYADLTAALGTNGANVPDALRKGGMSVKFVQSSDNKYVRYNLLADSFTTDITQWAIDDGGVYMENPEFVYVRTDKYDKVLWAIKTDGSIYYGAGVPQQIIDYITEKIAELSLDEYEDIVTFLAGIEEGDKTLQTLLDEKANASDVADKFEEDEEYIQATLDADNQVLEGITKDGKKKINIPIEAESIAEQISDAISPIEQHCDTIDEQLAALDSTYSEEIENLNQRVDEAGIVGVTADQINSVTALGTPVTIFGTNDTASSPNGAATTHDNFAFFESYLVQVSPTMLYMYYEACGTADITDIDPTDASAVTSKATTYMAYCDLSSGDAYSWQRGIPPGVTVPYAGTNKIKVLMPDGTELDKIVGGSVVKVIGDATYPFRLISGADIPYAHGGFDAGAGTFMWKSSDGVTFTHCTPIWKGKPDGQISAIVRGNVIKLYQRYRDPDNNDRQIGMMYIDTEGVLISPYHHFFGEHVYGAFASNLDARREILFPTSMQGGFHTICYIVDGAAYKSVLLPDDFTENGNMRWPYVNSNGLIHDNYRGKFYIFYQCNNNGHGDFGYDKPMYIKCREISFEI